jgi:uncharacterized protein YcnI
MIRTAMSRPHPRIRPVAATLAVLLAALAAPATAGAHATISPSVSLANKLQLYNLAVPTEKSGLTTSKIVMTVPNGFSIDSFVPPPPGWHQQVRQTGSGDSAVVTQVTWTGGRTPTGQDSLFQFLAEAANAADYSFHVEQTYSDGSIVNWSGPESAENPAPTIAVVGSVAGGGGTSTLTIVALIVAAVALGLAGLALVGRGGSGGRPLA